MSNELTLDNSQPVELYEFTSILGTHYFTSDVVDWDIDGNEYVSLSGLTRSAITIGTHEVEKDELQIEMPVRSNTGDPIPLAYDWAFATHPPELEVVIKRIDRAVGTSYVYWRGRVATIEVKGIVATFKCPTRFISILDGRVPTIVIQPQCNHVLFDARCGLDRATYTFTRTVSGFFGDWVLFSGALPASNPGLGAHNDFLNGEVINTRTNETRTITAVNGTNNGIQINYEFAELLVGDEIEISQGCDHNLLSDYGCSRYNNKVNYGGFTLIAGEDKNIFTVGLY